MGIHRSSSLVGRVQYQLGRAKHCPLKLGSWMNFQQYFLQETLVDDRVTLGPNSKLECRATCLSAHSELDLHRSLLFFFFFLISVRIGSVRQELHSPISKVLITCHHYGIEDSSNNKLLSSTKESKRSLGHVSLEIDCGQEPFGEQLGARISAKSLVQI